MELAKHWSAGLEDYVIDLQWSPDGARLAAASAAGPIAIFAAADGARTHELPGHDAGANCLAWAPAGPLASGGQDGAVKLWDAAQGRLLATVPLGAAWVEHLAWASGGYRPVLAAAAGRKLALLGPDGAILRPGTDLPKTVSALAWRPAGDPLLAAAFFGGVRLLGAEDLAVRRELPYGNGIQALVWSPDGRWLVSGNQDPSVHLWVPAEDAEFHMSGYEGKVRHLAFDPTSRWLATGGGGRDACLWDCAGAGPEGREPAMYPHDGPVCAVAFQRSHGLLATASQDGAVNLWSPDRRQPLRAAARLPAAPTRLAWSPDDRLLAIGAEDGQVHVLLCQP